MIRILMTENFTNQRTLAKTLRSGVNTSFVTAAKLAKALEMDSFPELQENGVTVKMSELTTSTIGL